VAADRSGLGVAIEPIAAIARPFERDEVREALAQAGVSGTTVTGVDAL